MPNAVTGDSFWFEKYPEINGRGYAVAASDYDPYSLSGYCELMCQYDDD